MSDAAVDYDLPDESWAKIIRAMELKIHKHGIYHERRRAVRIVVDELRRLKNEPTSRQELFVNLMAKYGLPALDGNGDNLCNSLIEESGFYLAATPDRAPTWEKKFYFKQRR